MKHYKQLIDDTLIFIAQKGWAMKGQSFYDSLALFLGKSLNMPYVIIDKLGKEKGSVETLSFVANGEISQNVTYSLIDTPCENVMGKNLCLYSSNIQKLFPNDSMLVSMNAESYIGIPLWGSDGNAIGLIALLDTKSIRYGSEIETILQIVAVRVAHEIERNNYELKLVTKNKVLERQNKELEQFNYIASHDLQEPLRTIISINQLLQEEFKGKLTEKADTYLHYINQSSSRMQELVKGLLDYSRIGRERELTKVDCNQVINEALLDTTVSIKESNAKITVQNLPQLNGYPTELRLLFQNLISNAIKFKKNTVKPEISISAEKRGSNWQFSIKDNGIGIDDKDKDKIFTIFKRLHNRNEYAGTGIGLSHCKKIVELHGGNIWVDSNPGKGSIFNFTIANL